MANSNRPSPKSYVLTLIGFVAIGVLLHIHLSRLEHIFADLQHSLSLLEDHKRTKVWQIGFPASKEKALNHLA